MKTPYLDSDINTLNQIKEKNLISKEGLCKLEEYKRIKQLLIQPVVNRRELLSSFEVGEKVVYRTGVIGTLSDIYENGMVGIKFGVNVQYVPVYEINKLKA